MELIKQIQDAIGSEKVRFGEDVQSAYHHIWYMDIPLKAKAILLPTSTEDVSIIMKLCNAANQAVIIHGGRTNLVGGTETNENEIVLSLEKMNAIEEVDTSSRTITVQAGVILENIQNAADANDLLFPLNFGAKGSTQAGGFIATNAGGLRVFRFGMTRNLVLGLEVVLPDGRVISSLKKIIKDNTGYDLKQLFVGSEGTLGIITKAVLKLVEKPQSRVSAFVGISSFEKVIQFFKRIDKGMGGVLSGYELLWHQTYYTMTHSNESISPPIKAEYPYYVLIEGLGSNQSSDQERMQSVLMQALEEGIIDDAVPAQSQSDLDWFWTIREDVHMLKMACTIDQHFDISLPIPLIGDYVDGVTKKLNAIPEVEIVFAFGHLADGNIHLIVGKENDADSLTNQINAVVYKPLKGLGGSVSAEHGIGVHKKAYLHLCRTPEELVVMKQLKSSFDPKGILNQGKIFD